MEISLEETRPWLYGGVLAGLAVALAILGYVVSPQVAGRPVSLSPERWRAVAMERRAAAEIGRLLGDSQALADLLAHEPPDAIRCMTLAQRIYAAHRAGTAVTAPARLALIAAAEALARYAAGGLERNTAIEALNDALDLIRAIAPIGEDRAESRLMMGGTGVAARAGARLTAYGRGGFSRVPSVLASAPLSHVP